jgi:hypothetical protein
LCANFFTILFLGMWLRLLLLVALMAIAARAGPAPDPKTYLVETADVAAAKPNPPKPVLGADYTGSGEDYYLIPCPRPPPGGSAKC